jgi:activator of HSP90 ATPase
MTRAIQQRVRFHASPEALFETFMDSKKHSASTGGRAVISRKVGGKFTAHNGALAGRNLAIIPNRMVVQSWRATHWKTPEVSILVLKFSKVPGGGQVDLVHTNVPAHDHKGVSKGWPKYYWKPWKKYFSRLARKG